MALGCRAISEIAPMEDLFVRNWLRRFGHHHAAGLEECMMVSASPRDQQLMICSAQRALGLEVTGSINAKTIARMNKMRCGCADRVALPSARKPQFHGECSLSVGVFANFDDIQGIKPSLAMEILQANFEKVPAAGIKNLRFKMQSSRADALIYIHLGVADPGVLAWMQVGDGCGWQHESLFNFAIEWSEDLFDGTILHEVIGHGAGVGHSNTIGGIMDPIMDPDVDAVIGPWMRKQLATRYGLIDDEPVPTPQPTPTPPTPGAPKMGKEEIILLILSMVKMCIDNGASQEIVARGIRNPNTRQRRAMHRKIKRKVKREEPGLRRSDRRIRVDTILDDVLARGREATDEQIAEIIRKAA